METKEEKLTWETPVIVDYDVVDTTRANTQTPGTPSDGQGYS